MTPSYQISVVIPTYQRYAMVRLALEALSRQTLAPHAYEVIVIIDGSNDGTREMVEQFVAPFKLRALWQANAGRAAACNAGIRVATGDIVVLLDDDMEATPGLLHGHLQEHAGRSRTAVIGAAPIHYNLTVAPVIAYVGAKFNRHLARLAQPDYQLGLRDCYSGNFSARRDLLLHVGLFDEAFKIYGNEDLELALRLRQAGAHLKYSSGALAYQSYDKDFPGLAQDSINKGRTAVLLVSKHPQAATELKIATYHHATRLRQLLLAGLLGMSRCWRGTPQAVIAFIQWIERKQLGYLELCYDIALDYCYWYGVHEALREHQSVKTRLKSLRARGRAC